MARRSTPWTKATKQEIRAAKKELRYYGIEERLPDKSYWEQFKRMNEVAAERRRLQALLKEQRGKSDISFSQIQRFEKQVLDIRVKLKEKATGTGRLTVGQYESIKWADKKTKDILFSDKPITRELLEKAFVDKKEVKSFSKFLGTYEPAKDIKRDNQLQYARDMGTIDNYFANISGKNSKKIDELKDLIAESNNPSGNAKKVVAMLDSSDFKGDYDSDQKGVEVTSSVMEDRLDRIIVFTKKIVGQEATQKEIPKNLEVGKI